MFEAACAREVMKPLSRSRPLWELVLVPQAESGHCGILFRVHHALADGFAAEALIGALADAGSTGASGAGAPGLERSGMARRPRRRRPKPRRRGARLRRLGLIAAETVAVFRHSVRSRVLLGQLSATRDVAFFDVNLREVHDGADRYGGTVNDAFLAAFGQGIRALLVVAGEQLPTTVPISCPVRLSRRAGEGNATGVMLVPVPVAEPHPRVAVVEFADVTRSEKARARAAGTFGLMAGPRAARLLMGSASGSVQSPRSLPISPGRLAP